MGIHCSSIALNDCKIQSQICIVSEHIGLSHGISISNHHRTFQLLSVPANTKRAKA